MQRGDFKREGRRTGSATIYRRGQGGISATFDATLEMQVCFPLLVSSVT